MTCTGECWEDRGDAPDGCSQRIIALHETLFPVIDERGEKPRLGFAKLRYHDHNPGPGGQMLTPEHAYRSERNGSFGAHACDAYNCASTKDVSWLDVAFDVDLNQQNDPDFDPEWNSVIDDPDEALAEIRDLWRDAHADAVARFSSVCEW